MTVKKIYLIAVALVSVNVTIHAQKTQLFAIPSNFSNGMEYNWANNKFMLIDMNGDGKPDLLDAENEGTNPDNDVFTTGAQSFWKVYLNTPTGFNAAATQWNIPKNFAHGLEHDLSNNEFAIIDMNGDKKPDLLDLENETTDTDEDVFVNGTQHFWKVYLNTGTGFSATAVQWNIPTKFQNGFEYKLDSEQFKLIDMNGDGKPDLLDTENEATNPDDDTFMSGSQKVWKIYLNTGSGF